MSNVLFRRDAGELQAYFVDAETTKYYYPISDGNRLSDLYIMEENITGGLLDLSVIVELPNNVDVWEKSLKISQLYNQLWDEITLEETISSDERYKIQERVNRLHELGFSVEEIQLLPTNEGNQLKIKTIVTEDPYHRKLLKSLTGIVAEESQARLMINQIYETQAKLNSESEKKNSIERVATFWFNNFYLHTLHQLGIDNSLLDAPQIYIQVLEHKWFLSERENRDVGLMYAVEDYLKKIGSKDEAKINWIEKLLLS